MQTDHSSDGRSRRRFAALRELRDDLVTLLAENQERQVGLTSARRVLVMTGQDDVLSLRELALFVSESKSTLGRIVGSAERYLRCQAPHLCADIGDDPGHNLQAPYAGVDARGRHYARCPL